MSRFGGGPEITPANFCKDCIRRLIAIAKGKVDEISAKKKAVEAVGYSSGYSDEVYSCYGVPNTYLESTKTYYYVSKKWIEGMVD